MKNFKNRIDRMVNSPFHLTESDLQAIRFNRELEKMSDEEIDRRLKEYENGYQ